MIVDFTKISWDERPVLLLKNLDGSTVTALGNVLGIKAELHYNETSKLTFRIPRYVDGKETPHYADVVGMRIVDWVGVGQFILVNPETTNKGGLVEEKSCTAYSLEYELTYSKSMVCDMNEDPEFASRKLYDRITPDGTALGYLLRDYPAWRVGSFDESYFGTQWRTFDDSSLSLYDWIKSKFQDSYQCIFDFDTYRREINMRAVTNEPPAKQIFISTDNLAKEIKIKEDTENVFTALDVQGAEGIHAGDVNPTGSSILYNLDYFMNTSYFPQELIDRWRAWEAACESYWQVYYDTTVAAVLKNAEWETARVALLRLQNEDLVKAEQIQRVLVEAQASNSKVKLDGESVEHYVTDEDMRRAKEEVDSINARISRKSVEVAALEAENNAMHERKESINELLAWERWFEPEEIALLKRYIKKDTLTEETFVLPSVNSYTRNDTSYPIYSGSFRVDGSNVVCSKTTELLDGGEVTTYVMTGGTMTVSCNAGTANALALTAKVISASIRIMLNGTFVLAAYLDEGNYGDTSFPRATVSMCGNGLSISSNASYVPEIGDGTYFEGNVVSGVNNSIDFYFTSNTSEYARHTVEQSLYEYGKTALKKLAWPSYSFEVSSANFLALDDFKLFKNQLTLGERIYLDLGGKVLKPIVVGVEVDYDNPENFKLEFGSTYSLDDSAFKLVDLLDESVSMGKSMAKNHLSYTSFVDSGASSAVHDFMTSALDAAKNAVLGGSGRMDVTIDGAGIRLREWASDSHDPDPSKEGGGYKKNQIWMINDNIVFTDDNWEHAKMALGHFHSEDLKEIDPQSGGDCFGLVADNIVGTLLAGSNLIIEGPKADGNNFTFRVDANGARLYNASFDIIHALQSSGTNQEGHIHLATPLGIVQGINSVAKPLFHKTNGEIDGVYTFGNTVISDLRSVNWASIYNWVVSHPSEESDITKGPDGVPRATFWVDMYGNSWFRGNIWAHNGYFSGTVHATDGEFNGTIYAQDGEFGGTLHANKIYGDLQVANNKSASLQGVNIQGCTLDVGAGTSSGVPSIGRGKFSVDINGNVSMSGNINMSQGNLTLADGSISWGKIDENARTALNNAIAAANSAAVAAGNAASDAQDAADIANGIIDGWKYNGPTYIDSTKLVTQNVIASTIAGGTVNLLGCTGWDSNGQALNPFTAGHIALASSSTGIAVDISSIGGARLIANNGGNLYLSAGGGSGEIHLANANLIEVGGELCTRVDTITLGSFSRPWGDLYLKDYGSLTQALNDIWNAINSL